MRSHAKRGRWHLSLASNMHWTRWDLDLGSPTSDAMWHLGTHLCVVPGPPGNWHFRNPSTFQQSLQVKKNSAVNITPATTTYKKSSVISCQDTKRRVWRVQLQAGNAHRGNDGAEHGQKATDLKISIALPGCFPAQCSTSISCKIIRTP